MNKYFRMVAIFLFAAGVAVGFLFSQIAGRSSNATEQIFAIQRPFYGTFRTRLLFLKEQQPPMMTQMQININAAAWADLNKLSLFLILLEELERSPVRERKSVLKDYFDWQRYFQENTDAFAARQSGTGGSMHAAGYAQRLLELRIAYQTAPAEQQAIFREIRNFGFLCRDREFILSHGYYEEDLQDNGWTNQFTLQVRSCNKWTVGSDVFHSALMEQQLRDIRRTVKIIWKNGAFQSCDLLK